MTKVSHNPSDGERALARRLAEIERRLRDLETANPLENATIQDGSLKIRDADRNEIVRVGKLDPGNEFGLEVFDPATGASRLQLGKLGGTLGNGLQIFSPDGSSHTLLVTDDLGMAIPWQLIPLGSPDDIRYTTPNTSFVEAFLGDFAALSNELSWNIAVSPPSGGSMDVRATLAPIGGSEVTLDTRTYSVAGQDLWEFPSAFSESDIGGSFRLRIKVKKNSGTGEASIGIVTHPVNRS